jgi:hypothetical protein
MSWAHLFTLMKLRIRSRACTNQEPEFVHNYFRSLLERSIPRAFGTSVRTSASTSGGRRESEPSSSAPSTSVKSSSLWPEVNWSTSKWTPWVDLSCENFRMFFCPRLDYGYEDGSVFLSAHNNLGWDPFLLSEVQFTVGWSEKHANRRAVPARKHSVSISALIDNWNRHIKQFQTQFKFAFDLSQVLER